MSVCVLYHDNYFDGATSAALFTAFYRQCISKTAGFSYRGMTHGSGDVFAGAFSDAAPRPEYVCVDFRYSPDERLGWWFDHHQSAFITPADEAQFQARHNPHHFYDPAARSCSKFLAERCAEAFGFDTRPYKDLIAWADLIDGAQFASPAQAVECKEPALQLMLWVEWNREVAHKERFIADLGRAPLAEIAAQPYVQSGLLPLQAENERLLALLRERTRYEDGVVTYDLTDQPVRSVSKFAPYYLYPDAHYVVGLALMPGRVKISVGSNPWQAARRQANIATLCGQYGGGGHPAVGAVSFPSDQIARGKAAADEITAVLRSAAQKER